MQLELKPCPFCGSIDIDAEMSLAKSADGVALVNAGCFDCGVLGPDAPTVDEAAAKWNERAQVAAEDVA